MSFLVLAAVFISILYLTLVLKKGLFLSAAFGLVVAIISYWFLFDLDVRELLEAIVHGALTATEICLLIFGALVFYNYLKSAWFIQHLEKALIHFSLNKVIIVITLAFFFGSFFEGVSGFGTPAMIIAPLLLNLRFPAYLAAAIPLLANTIPVIFGAVGTPVKVGFADLLTGTIGVYAALLMALPAMILPLLLKRLMENNNALALETSKSKMHHITLGAGLCFVIPFTLSAYFGYELPSIIAALAGLPLWLFLVKTTGSFYATITLSSLMGFFKAFKPYLAIAAIMIAGRFVLGNSTFSIEWPAVNLRKNINFFQPGLFFVLGLFAFYFLSTNRPSISIKAIFAGTIARLPTTFATITCLTILARLLSQNLDLQDLFGTTSGGAGLLIYNAAILTGVIGSFMAGSATVSNLLFGSEWYQVAQQFDLQTSLLLAGQLAGAALGNALSIQNIAMVQAVLNEDKLAPDIMKVIWKPILLLFLLTSATVNLLAIFVDGAWK